MRLFHRERFCRRCGQRYIRQEYRYGFDRRTGAPVVRSFVSCPKLNYPDTLTNDNDCWPTPPRLPE